MNKKSVVPVTESPKPNESFLTFNNNQLEYYSNKSFIGESMVYDTTGKQIAILGTKSFIVGKNIIQTNQQLPVGVYLLTIKNGIEQLTYKFIVE